MADLSPAAQAVLDAVAPHPVYEPAIAAALRALADQVAPRHAWRSSTEGELTKDDVRDEILAIAAELEGGND